MRTRFKLFFYTLGFSEWLGVRGRYFPISRQRRWAIGHLRFGYFRRYPVWETK